MSKMKASALVAQAINIAKNYKTLYVMGCFGAPMTAKNKERYKNNNDYNRQAARQRMIQNATADTFGFDCVCLIKGILWGWCGDQNATYGGATYASNGVPDISADGMIARCSGVSTNFDGIVPGEAVWKSGHIGIYIGNGLAVECTPSWANCVQITAVGNIGKVSGYNTRTWTKHGKMPYVDYAAEPSAQDAPETEPETAAQPTVTAELQALIRAETETKVKAAIESVLGVQIDTFDQIPHNSVKKEIRPLLDCGAIDGGTEASENPNDIRLPYAIVRALAIMKRYVERYVDDALATSLNGK